MSAANEKAMAIAHLVVAFHDTGIDQAQSPHLKALSWISMSKLLKEEVIYQRTCMRIATEAPD